MSQQPWKQHFDGSDGSMWLRDRRWLVYHQHVTNQYLSLQRNDNPATNSGYLEMVARLQCPHLFYNMPQLPLSYHQTAPSVPSWIHCADQRRSLLAHHQPHQRNYHQPFHSHDHLYHHHHHHHHLHHQSRTWLDPTSQVPVCRESFRKWRYQDGRADEAMSWRRDENSQENKLHQANMDHSTFKNKKLSPVFHAKETGSCGTIGNSHNVLPLREIRLNETAVPFQRPVTAGNWMTRRAVLERHRRAHPVEFKHTSRSPIQSHPVAFPFSKPNDGDENSRGSTNSVPTGSCYENEKSSARDLRLHSSLVELTIRCSSSKSNSSPDLFNGRVEQKPKSGTWNWFSQEEQEHIVQMLKEVDIRHEKQMRKNYRSPQATTHSPTKTTSGQPLKPMAGEGDSSKLDMDLSEECSSSDDGIDVILPSEDASQSQTNMDPDAELASALSMTQISDTEKNRPVENGHLSTTANAEFNTDHEYRPDWGKSCSGWNSSASSFEAASGLLVHGCEKSENPPEREPEWLSYSTHFNTTMSSEYNNFLDALTSASNHDEGWKYYPTIKDCPITQGSFYSKSGEEVGIAKQTPALNEETTYCYERDEPKQNPNSPAEYPRCSYGININTSSCQGNTPYKSSCEKSTRLENNIPCDIALEESIEVLTAGGTEEREWQSTEHLSELTAVSDNCGSIISLDEFKSWCSIGIENRSRGFQGSSTATSLTFCHSSPIMVSAVSSSLAGIGQEGRGSQFISTERNLQIMRSSPALSVLHENELLTVHMQALTISSAVSSKGLAVEGMNGGRNELETRCGPLNTLSCPFETPMCGTYASNHLKELLGINSGEVVYPQAPQSAVFQDDSQAYLSNEEHSPSLSSSSEELKSILGIGIQSLECTQLPSLSDDRSHLNMSSTDLGHIGQTMDSIQLAEDLPFACSRGKIMGNYSAKKSEKNSGIHPKRDDRNEHFQQSVKSNCQMRNSLSVDTKEDKKGYIHETDTISYSADCTLPKTKVKPVNSRVKCRKNLRKKYEQHVLEDDCVDQICEKIDKTGIGNHSEYTYGSRIKKLGNNEENKSGAGRKTGPKAWSSIQTDNHIARRTSEYKSDAADISKMPHKSAHCSQNISETSKKLYKSQHIQCNGNSRILTGQNGDTVRTKDGTCQTVEDRFPLSDQKLPHMKLSRDRFKYGNNSGCYLRGKYDNVRLEASLQKTSASSYDKGGSKTKNECQFSTGFQKDTIDSVESVSKRCDSYTSHHGLLRASSNLYLKENVDVSLQQADCRDHSYRKNQVERKNTVGERSKYTSFDQKTAKDSSKNTNASDNLRVRNINPITSSGTLVSEAAPRTRKSNQLSKNQASRQSTNSFRNDSHNYSLPISNNDVSSSCKKTSSTSEEQCRHQDAPNLKTPLRGVVADKNNSIGSLTETKFKKNTRGHAKRRNNQRRNECPDNLLADPTSHSGKGTPPGYNNKDRNSDKFRQRIHNPSDDSKTSEYSARALQHRNHQISGNDKAVAISRAENYIAANSQNTPAATYNPVVNQSTPDKVIDNASKTIANERSTNIQGSSKKLPSPSYSRGTRQSDKPLDANIRSSEVHAPISGVSATHRGIGRPSAEESTDKAKTKLDDVPRGEFGAFIPATINTTTDTVGWKNPLLMYDRNWLVEVEVLSKCERKYLMQSFHLPNNSNLPTTENIYGLLNAQSPENFSVRHLLNSPP